MKTALFEHPIYRQHVPPAGHPERPERLEAVDRGVRALRSQLRSIQASEVESNLLQRVHPAAHLARLREACTALQSPADPAELAALWSEAPVDLVACPPRAVMDVDTYTSSQSLSAALHGCGAAAEAARGVLAGTFDRAFCAIRPPGHHAAASQAMGFCLLNNVAVAAEQALALGAARVAILDWDLHHGNGTQDLFWRRAEVFYASVHQRPLYPGTGASEERGAEAGLGTTLNCPLPAGADDHALVAAWDSAIAPALERFQPDLLCISAGFDADRRDPLSGLEVSAAGLAELSRRVVQWSRQHCGGRIVSVLEGGYHLDALEEDVRAHVTHLAEL